MISTDKFPCNDHYKYENNLHFVTFSARSFVNRLFQKLFIIKERKLRECFFFNSKTILELDYYIRMEH